MTMDALQQENATLAIVIKDLQTRIKEYEAWIGRNEAVIGGYLALMADEEAARDTKAGAQ